MSNGALSIPITADASKFLKTLETVKAEIKTLKKELETATGERVGRINFEITGLEQQKNAFKEFGAFAEGTYGRLLQQLDYLNAYALTLKVDSTELKNTFAEIDSVKEQIKVIQGKEIKIPAEVFMPPAGSIDYIKQQIDSISKSKGILVGVELTEANVKLKALKDELKRLETQGVEVESKPISPVLENSLEGLELKLAKLKKASIKIDVLNEQELAKANTEIAELESRIQRLKGLTIDPNGKITQSAGKARQAVTSLSLVAQDLPFGFIAIQNNLPAVAQTFGQLVSQSNGVKGALTSLRGALLGPAGAFLAFSAITAAVTVAVKEYGSFGAAIRALTGRSTELDGILLRAKDSLEKYNKELITTKEISAEGAASAAGEVASIKALANAVKDVTLSESQRANALKELKEIDPKNLENIKNTTEGYKDLDVWVKKYTESLISKAVAEEYSARIGAVTAELGLQQVALKGLTEEYDELARQRKEAGKPRRGEDPTIANARIIGVLAQFSERQKDLNKRFFAQAEVVTELNKQLDTYTAGLQQATNEATKFFKENKDPKDPKERKIDFKFNLELTDDYKELTDYNSLDKSMDRLKQYADVVLDVNKTEKERSTALRKLGEDSKAVYGIDEDLFKGMVVGKTSLKDLTLAVEIYGYKLQELIVEELRFQKTLKESERFVSNWGASYKSAAADITGARLGDTLDALFKEIDFNQIKDLAQDLPKGVLDSFKEFDGKFPSLEKFKQNILEILSLEFLKTGFLNDARINEIINQELSKLKSNVQTEIALNVDFDQLSKGTELIEKQVEKIKNNIISAFSGVQNILENTFFDLLDEGKTNWKEFSNAVIKEVKRITAALIAKTLVTALANLLAPGSGTAVSQLLKTINTQALGDWLNGEGALPIPDISDGDALGSANFGGIRGSDMSMSGQVVVTLRGNDLVGAINRNNALITRVG